MPCSTAWLLHQALQEDYQWLLLLLVGCPGVRKEPCRAGPASAAALTLPCLGARSGRLAALHSLCRRPRAPSAAAGQCAWRALQPACTRPYIPCCCCWS